ncbi:protein phosphatase 1 regulatory subunit 3E-like [Ambystoma mexicanum]|uniref:protein phosphatase 1 regulatory subunit 3E-like n=1 Tax=Ambystoma mexicanum TaxID=8296 RepID=UPI0037E721BB
MEKTAAMPPPPRLYLPRNFSCTACLYGSLGEPCKGLEEQDEERGCQVLPPPKLKESELEDAPPEEAIVEPTSDKPSRGREPTLVPQSPGARRRAKSLPTPGERAPQLEIAAAHSPSRRKTVRFADSLGLELTAVRHFSDADAPRVPSHILNGLRKTPRPAALGELSVLLQTPVQSVMLEPLFPANPGAQPGFLERVQQKHLCLESLCTDQFSISGLVRVLNESYEKSVTVRYSLDRWASSVDCTASYLPGPSDRHTDRFSFKLVTPSLLEKGGLLEFAIRYCVCGTEYWDNNEGLNYRVRSHRLKVSPPRDFDSAWIHFI